ncbi:MAG: hypothetical protein HRT38_13555 [Alteromonadaceae bacterium]|nr:hypothetical protein [Alteromonadaceae bacterium]
MYSSLGNFVQNKSLFNSLKETLVTSKTLLTWELTDFSHVNYLTTPATVLPEALEKLFEDRQPQDIKQFAHSGIRGVKHYFKQLEKKYGFSVSPLATLHDLGQLQLENANLPAAMKTFKHLSQLKPTSIYYLTLLASAQKDNQQTDLAKQTLNRALVLAKASQHQGEINYVKSQISLLN